MTLLGESIERLAKKIAEDREDLVESQSTLKDDELYLKDLTARCEARANDYDQRSAMRGDEITALSTALKILKDEVTPAEKVNVRALLLQRASRATDAAATPGSNAAVVPSSLTRASISFLQG